MFLPRGAENEEFEEKPTERICSFSAFAELKDTLSGMYYMSEKSLGSLEYGGRQST
jgi:hypothetical protein